MRLITSLQVIHGAAMWASALALHRCAAMAATIAHAVVLEVLTNGEKLIEDKQGVAEIVSDDIGEDKIEHHTHAHEGGEI